MKNKKSIRMGLCFRKVFYSLLTVLCMVAFFAACSNSSSTPTPEATQTPIPTPTSTTEQTPVPTPTPTPAATYTVTFNANDGSENPATATQSFTEGTPQALKTIAELGFSKSGFNFAGWGTSSNASQSEYADGTSYTASANVMLYAVWSSVPVYSVKISVNANGSVTATPATAESGAVITLVATPNAGYKFNGYNVMDVNSNPITVDNGKFTMPAKNVTVTASFTAINYTITCGTCEHGTVSASQTTATVGAEVTLAATPSIGWRFLSYTVLDVDSKVIETQNGKFIMPAKNVTVSAIFSEIPSASGSYTALPAGTDGSAGVNASYVTFGLWPQTVMANNVTIDKTQCKQMGNLKCYKGSDGEFYVSAIGNSVVYQGKYSDNTVIGNGGIERYFRVEPIKWCIVTENYNESGKKLLVAEKCLFTAKFGESSKQTYIKSNIRSKLVDYFFNAAFTESEKALIADTLVDNSPSSTYPYSETNPYACDNTTDKVFALSVKEACYLLSSKKRTACDYSLANLGDGKWWLRTHDFEASGFAYVVTGGGTMGKTRTDIGALTSVVPALCVSN